MKNKTGVEKINTICQQILMLTEKDFKECESMAMGQKTYTHPFKMETQRRQNELGESNLRVTYKIKELAAILIDPDTKTS